MDSKHVSITNSQPEDAPSGPSDNLYTDEQGVQWAGNVPVMPPPGAVSYQRTIHGLVWLDTDGQWHNAKAGQRPVK